MNYKRTEKETLLLPEDLNDYFINVGLESNSAADKEKANTFVNKLNINTERSFYLQETNETEIMFIIKRLKKKQTEDIFL